MRILGALLILIALVLVIVYAVGERMNKTMLGLGLVLGGIGIVILVLRFILGG